MGRVKSLRKEFIGSLPLVLVEVESNKIDFNCVSCTYLVFTELDISSEEQVRRILSWRSKSQTLIDHLLNIIEFLHVVVGHKLAE